MNFPSQKKAFRLALRAAVLGIALAFSFSLMWRLINFDYVQISTETRDALSGLTLVLCPSSFVLMEVGPRERITPQVAAIYGEVILLNGALYGLITFLGANLVGILRSAAKD